MYIVKNISSHDITIPELRVTLAPNEKLDLDMISSRFYIDQSSLLRNLFRTNKLKCIIKNNDRGELETSEPDNPKPVAQERNQQSVIDAVKQLEEKLTKRLDEKVQNTQSNLDVNALNQVLHTLQTLVGKNADINNKTSEQSNTHFSDNIDDAKMIDIQKRTVNRLVTKTESSVRHEEQTTDKDVTKNAKELEGLL